jgi:hypothetical protein
MLVALSLCLVPGDVFVTVQELKADSWQKTNS